MMTNYKIIFSKEALKDLKEAKHWYNLQQKDLGKRLVADIINTINKIQTNPYHTSVKFENIRTSACKTFPYSIHYEVDDDIKLIRILSIFHFSRKPYWL